MASSRDLITIFVGLELVTGPTFLMAGWRKGDARSNEAALKFFIIGVLSSAVLLFGMSLVYGATGTISFEGIRSASAALSLSDQPLFTLGVVFTLLGFAFKVSAVPFHFWTPDTYEGAPTPVTAYLSVVSKAAGFTGLLVYGLLRFCQRQRYLGPGFVDPGRSIDDRRQSRGAAPDQHRATAGVLVDRPGGVHVGPVWRGGGLRRFSRPARGCLFATVTYLLIYAFMNLGAFAVVIAVRNRLGSAELDDWSGLFRYAPGLAALLAVFFFSLAGIPPLAGWFAKFVMFRSTLSFGGGWAVALAVIAVVNAVIAFAYYAKVVKSTWFDAAPESLDTEALGAVRVVPSLQLALGLTLTGVLVLASFPTSWQTWAT